MLRYVVLALVALLTLAAAVAGGCSDDDPVGEYECVGGELQTLFEDMSLVLFADGSVMLTGTMPVGGEQDLSGTWTRDGSQVEIVMDAEGSSEAEIGRYEDGRLIFEDLVWAKQ